MPAGGIVSRAAVGWQEAADAGRAARGAHALRVGGRRVNLTADANGPCAGDDGGDARTRGAREGRGARAATSIPRAERAYE